MLKIANINFEGTYTAEDSSAHQGCIYLIDNTVKQYEMLLEFKITFLFEYI